MGEVSLALLAFGAGCTDGLSYTVLGHVLASAMTGNAALLGLAIAAGHLGNALHNLLALLGFIAGAAVGCLPLMGRERTARARGLTRGFALEAVLLAGFAGLLAAETAPFKGLVLYALIILAAAGMGVQATLARDLDAPGISTTFFTGTLTDIVRGVFRISMEAPSPISVAFRTARQTVAFGFFGLGAVSGGLLAMHRPSFAGIAPLAAVVVVLGLRLAGQTAKN